MSVIKLPRRRNLGGTTGGVRFGMLLGAFGVNVGYEKGQFGSADVGAVFTIGSQRWECERISFTTTGFGTFRFARIDLPGDKPWNADYMAVLVAKCPVVSAPHIQTPPARYERLGMRGNALRLQPYLGEWVSVLVMPALAEWDSTWLPAATLGE